MAEILTAGRDEGGSIDAPTTINQGFLSVVAPDEDGLGDGQVNDADAPIEDEPVVSADPEAHA